MECSTCEWLRALRDLKERVYANTLGVIRAEAETADTSRYARLRSEVQTAKLELDLATAEFLQHQDLHAVPN